jgi:hypothetical protein
MSLIIEINTEIINNLDLTKAKEIIEHILKGNIVDNEQKLQFKINYDREETDPRELSEIPEIRLWFVRLDAQYPYLPYFLNWKEGELARYTAMLVPHQFNRVEGIHYNLEALEIFVMSKIFTISNWQKNNNITGENRLKLMAQMFGYEIEESFFQMLENS